MKKRLLIAVTAGLVCIGGIYVAVNTFRRTNNISMSLYAQNLEALAAPESKYCYNGGPGSSSCTIDGGIDIAGFGVSAACSVSCNSGYYACCTLRCTCVKES